MPVMPTEGSAIYRGAVEPHPDLGPLTSLLGTWVGEGAGEYPTIEPFRYREEAVFGHVGKPFLAYRQATVNLATGLPAHAETGYLRAVGDDRVELVLVHPTGLAEVAVGTVAVPATAGAGGPVRSAVHLRSLRVAGTPTAREVTSVERTIEVEGDTLRYLVAMGAVGQPHQHHLQAELRRQPPV